MTGVAFVHRLVRINSNQGIFVNVHKYSRWIRPFLAGSVKCTDTGADKSGSSNELSSRLTPLSGRKRPLSPLERIIRLLPRDALNPEVMKLREPNQSDPTEDTRMSDTHFTPEESEPKVNDSDRNTSGVQPNSASHEGGSAATLPGERLLAFGELLVVEYLRKRRSEFRKMIQLQSGARLVSSWGVIAHDDMVGQAAGRFLKTSMGIPLLIRRSSLEDYVLFMKRGPAIAYPKDVATMLLMMDVTEGDCVLESGSGSGAMSLFLSRAVGSKGSVMSLEVREDHHRRAVLNYNRWRTAWSLRRGEEWPDNVQFHNANICTSSSLLARQGFHAAALDLIHPHLALPTVAPRLHPGAVCVVYLANVTQVIDLLEGLRCSALSLLCERIVEVPVRDWLVAPALQKDGRYCIRKAPLLPEEQLEEEEAAFDETDEVMTTSNQPAFGSVPYICRPNHVQMSHTAFLVKLRKCVL